MSLIERLGPKLDGAIERWPRPLALPTRMRSLVAASRATELWVLPLLMTLAVVAGIGVVSAITPIIGRGDYGQWLMTSRYYLGQSVPDYRVVPELPPLIPLVLAAIRVLVPDPVIALQVLNVVLVLALAMSFFMAGAILLEGPIGGLLSVVVGLLVTDRFLELAAFGGELQLASIVCINVAVAAFAHAGAGPARPVRWWTLGSLSLAVAALAHVGTATIGIPIVLAVAGFALLRQRALGWRALGRIAWPLGVAVVLLAAYWFLVLLPQSRDYVTNPASLGYRGPGRLMSGLFAYWPETVAIVVGAAAIVLGVVWEVIRRSPGLRTAVFVWAALAWGSLVLAVMTGASTDYPRFATPLVAPLVIGAAGALTWLARSVGAYLATVWPGDRSPLLLTTGIGLLIVLAAPFSVVHYQGQMSVYGSRDPDSLNVVARYVDQQLGASRGAVLTSVRDGKWFEGITGRAALFSQPVRYAFRSDEWQRSVDADAILRSTAALTNQFFFVKFTGTGGTGASGVPRGLLIAANHGGEFVDLLQVPPAATQVLGPGSSVSTAESGVGKWTAGQTWLQARVSTEWTHRVGRTAVSYAQSVTLLNNGSTLNLTATAPGNHLRTELRPAPGIAFTSAHVVGQEADVCFTRIGDTEPCVRVWASQPDVVVAVNDRALTITSRTASSVRVYVTDLTAGAPSVGLALINPASLVARYRVGAAILDASDPVFPSRRQRLEALGFRVTRMIGTYAVMLRSPASGPT